MALQLVGACDRSPVWCKVRRNVDEWFDNCPPWAARWTLTVRPKTAADDDMLVEDGEADDPAHYWAVFIDGDALHLIVAVPADAGDDLHSTVGTAGFLIELLGAVADPSDP